jgi:hypothetical protein
MTAFCVIAPCSLVKVDGRLRRTTSIIRATMEAGRNSETSDDLNEQQSAISLKAVIFILAAMRT